MLHKVRHFEGQVSITTSANSNALKQAVRDHIFEANTGIKSTGVYDNKDDHAG